MYVTAANSLSRLTQYRYSLTEYWYSLTQYRYSLTEYRYSLTQYRYSLTEYWYSLTQYQYSLTEYWYSLTEEYLLSYLEIHIAAYGQCCAKLFAAVGKYLSDRALFILDIALIEQAEALEIL